MIRIELRASGALLSEALEEHMRRRVDFALRRFAESVDRVVVRLVDLNGPRGGIDKRCRIVARLASPAPSVIVEATAADAYAAVSVAAARLDERVARTLSRQRDWPAAARHAVRQLPRPTWLGAEDPPKEPA